MWVNVVVYAVARVALSLNFISSTLCSADLFYSHTEMDTYNIFMSNDFSTGKHSMCLHAIQFASLIVPHM